MADNDSDSDEEVDILSSVDERRGDVMFGEHFTHHFQPSSISLGHIGSLHGATAVSFPDQHHIARQDSDSGSEGSDSSQSESESDDDGNDQREMQRQPRPHCHITIQQCPHLGKYSMSSTTIQQRLHRRRSLTRGYIFGRRILKRMESEDLGDQEKN
ncbi:hypothetical protein OS493_021228 [Desmophyllum pertusum]|uniref:Uncharacterized protein n=1 Tax=Desmophyllum pertusum TaxID=174260 RepID=A0A9X0D2W2_9CNID|nr:hypothetical protein OS493_021228 [Desmophyllum pertusum]